MTSIFNSRVPLSRIQQIDDISANLKRSIIISYQKLPKDFFPTKNILNRELSIPQDRTNILSQKMQRNFSDVEYIR